MPTEITSQTFWSAKNTTKAEGHLTEHEAVIRLAHALAVEATLEFNRSLILIARTLDNRLANEMVEQHNAVLDECKTFFVKLPKAVEYVVEQ